MWIKLRVTDRTFNLNWNFTRFYSYLTPKKCVWSPPGTDNLAKWPLTTRDWPSCLQVLLSLWSLKNVFGPMGGWLFVAMTMLKTFYSKIIESDINLSLINSEEQTLSKSFWDLPQLFSRFFLSYHFRRPTSLICRSIAAKCRIRWHLIIVRQKLIKKTFNASWGDADASLQAAPVPISSNADESMQEC